MYSTVAMSFSRCSVNTFNESQMVSDSLVLYFRLNMAKFRSNKFQKIMLLAVSRFIIFKC
jgi:hypothetical protein